MSDETNLSAQTTMGTDSIQETMDKFLSAADVGAVYGRPIRHGETIIIPTAEVLSGMGFGLGYGSGTTVGEEGEEPASGGVAGGGGGGGRVLSRPVAVVIASPEGVRVEPVVDVTKIFLALLTAGGFMFGMGLRMLSAKRGLPQIEE